VELGQLSIDELRQFSPLIEADLYESIALEQSLAGKAQIGGTAPVQVAMELARAREILRGEEPEVG